MREPLSLWHRSLLVERWDLQPAVISRVPGRPDDGRDACLGEIQDEEWVIRAHGMRIYNTCLWLFREIKTVPLNVGVCLFQNRQVAGITFGDVFHEIWCKSQNSVPITLRASDQDHALRRKPPEIDSMSAVRPADRDRHMFRCWRGCRRAPLSKYAQPPDEIAIGRAFAGLLAMSASRTPFQAARGMRSLEGKDDPTGTPANTPAVPVLTTGVEAFSATNEKLRVSDDPSERLLQSLRTSGGEVFGGQRSFAKAVSISPAHVNGLLHDLRAAGRVFLDVGKHGTRVKLIA